MGCFWSGRQVAEQTAVQVGEARLSTKSFADQLARRLRNFDALAAQDPKNIERAKKDIVEQFLIRGLTQEWAKREGISVHEKELDEEVNRVRASYPDDLAFRRVLAREGLSLEEWRSELRYRLLEKKVFDELNKDISNPSEEEIQSYYDENIERFRRGERVYLRQIVLDQEVTASAVRQNLSPGNFADKAKDLSIAPEARQGGLLGWIEKGVFEVFDEAFEVPVGRVSRIFESPYGYHLFLVERKAPAGQMPLSEVRTQIVDTLRATRQQERYSRWLDQQLRQTRVLKNEDLIQSLRVETRSF